MYRGHRKGSGGPPGGATPPGGPHGLRGAGSQPLVGWPHPLPWALAPRVEGGNPRGGAPLCLGGKSPLPGRRPPSRSHLGGPAPLAPSPINRGVRGGQPNHNSRRSPSPPQHLSSSVRAWRSPVGILPHHLHHAVVLPLELSSSSSPSSLLDQDEGDVARTVCVLNAEVLSVQHLVIGDLNHGEFDSIITIPLNASALDLQVVCR